MIDKLRKELKKEADSKQSKILQKFFKTGKGEYGEGDIFLGIKVPVQRKIAKKYSGLNFIKINELIGSKIHEERLVGLLILVDKYERGKEEEKAEIFNLYLKNAKKINNWDLVDLTAPKIVGNFLFDKKKHRNILDNLAKSNNLWEKRISIVSTFYFIKKGELFYTLRISEILLKDSHDLIHKAVGWMLRELGKKDLDLLKNFLMENYSKIPRTTLRYSIERFEEKERIKFLKRKF